MFGDSDAEALTCGVGKCLVSNVKRDVISARNYTGLMDTCYVKLRTLTYETFEVTFSKQTAVGETLIDIIIVNVIRIGVIISMIYRV